MMIIGLADIGDALDSVAIAAALLAWCWDPSGTVPPIDERWLPLSWPPIDVLQTLPPSMLRGAVRQWRRATAIQRRRWVRAIRRHASINEGLVDLGGEA